MPPEDANRDFVSPDPLAAAESNQGKKVSDNEGATTIRNLDGENAAHMVYLDRLKERAMEINRDIQEELQDQARSEDSRLMAGFDVSSRMVELHALTLTYFEGVAFQFLKWAWEVDHELETHVRNHHLREFTRDTPPREWDRETVKSFSDGMSIPRWFHALRDSGIYTSDLDAIHDVKDRRNTYVHSPEQALELRASQDTYPGKALVEHPHFDPPEEVREQLRAEAPDDSAGEVLVDCITALEATETIVDEHLPLDEGIYDAMRSGE